MKRYRVKKINAVENPVYLSFPDLSAKFSNGYSIPLKVKEGDELPLDVVDVEDIRKSLRIGSLHGYLMAGRLEEIEEEPPKRIIVVPEPMKVEVKKEAAINLDKETFHDVKVVVAETTSFPPQSPSTEGSLNQKENMAEEITDLTVVQSYDEFLKLPYFLKLKFIRESSNLDLLKEISDKTSSSQFKNNIFVRLSK